MNPTNSIIWRFKNGYRLKTMIRIWLEWITFVNLQEFVYRMNCRFIFIYVKVYLPKFLFYRNYWIYYMYLSDCKEQYLIDKLGKDNYLNLTIREINKIEY